MIILNELLSLHTYDESFLTNERHVLSRANSVHSFLEFLKINIFMITSYTHNRIYRKRSLFKPDQSVLQFRRDSL